MRNWPEVPCSPKLDSAWAFKMPHYAVRPNSRESNMPDTPPEPTLLTSTAPSVSPNSVDPTTASLTPNNKLGSNVMNGIHSPTMNGSRGPRTPSPSTPNQSQQLPPACGARQLSKLKRFLTTLQQFGSDISPEIGERVRTLVLGLVNSHLSIEEFHAKLQEATNFPLRPFVIPFLKANLPLLQRELLHCARLAKQTPQQYLMHNEHILFDPAHAVPENGAETGQNDLNENGKRRAATPERAKDTDSSDVHPAKRHQPHPVSPGGNNRISPGVPGFNNNFGPIRLEDISISREMRERERVERERFERETRERHYSNSSYNSYQRDTPFDHLDRQEDDWKHIENMLHCIVSMVDKTKRALSTLQERSQRDREELSLWMRRHSDGLDHDIKKRDQFPYNRSAEDRIGEVKRRAEEAVNEVKRQAVIELQKAVAAAEQKANELVSSEKIKMERAIGEVKKKAREEVLSMFNKQEESSESCWNCGRKANETCSGCNLARYCGSFCQHKDWESHHRVCGQSGQERAANSNRESGRSPPSSIPVTRPVSTPPVSSPANSSSTASVKGSRSNSPDDQTGKDSN